MSSMLRNEPWPGPYTWPEVVPRTIRGDTLVTKSCRDRLRGHFELYFWAWSKELMLSSDTVLSKKLLKNTLLGKVTSYLCILVYDCLIPYPVQKSLSERSPILVQKPFWSWQCLSWEEQRPGQMGWEIWFHRPRHWCPPGQWHCRTMAALELGPQPVHAMTANGRRRHLNFSYITNMTFDWFRPELNTLWCNLELDCIQKPSLSSSIQ